MERRSRKKVIVEGIIHEQGSRDHMEDRHAIIDSEHWLCFAVFDGHGGEEVSHRIASPTEGLLPFQLARLQHAWPKGILQPKIRGGGFRKLSKVRRDSVKNLLQKSFKEYDEEILLTEFGSEAEVGSTCSLVVFTNPPEALWICNLGDSRTTLFDIKPVPSLRFMTIDHKPEMKEEKKRIENAGGKVTRTRDDVFRINHLTAVSRGFGDFHLKPNLISIVPDIQFFDSLPECYLILATDGVWDEIEISHLTEWLHSYPHSFCRKAVDWILTAQPEADNLTFLALHLV